MSKVPGNFTPNVPPSQQGQLPPTTQQNRRERMQRQSARFSLPPNAKIKVENAEWTLERQKLVAAFVDSLKTANANPKALVDAAAKVFKDTKGLDPTVTSLLTATIKDLPPGAQTIVFENVEKIEGKLHSLNVPPPALQLPHGHQGRG